MQYNTPPNQPIPKIIDAPEIGKKRALAIGNDGSHNANHSAVRRKLFTEQCTQSKTNETSQPTIVK